MTFANVFSFPFLSFDFQRKTHINFGIGSIYARVILKYICIKTMKHYKHLQPTRSFVSKQLIAFDR